MEDELLQSVAALKSQLYECHLRLGSVSKEKKKFEQKNDEMQVQINKLSGELTGIQLKVREAQKRIEAEASERRNLEEQNCALEL